MSSLQLHEAIAPPAFRGDDAWVHRHLQARDAERARRNGPDGGFPSVETVRFNRVAFTEQIQVCRPLCSPGGRGLLMNGFCFDLDRSFWKRT
jgi:hypothetical protein